MTKIVKKYYTNESYNNIYKKFFHLYGNVDNNDYTLLTNILEQKFNLSFDSNRRCEQNNSIFISEGSNGYFVADTGSNALGLHGFNSYRLLKRMFDAGETYNPTTTTTLPHTTKATPKKSAKPCNASFYPIEQNTTLFDHLTTKTGATLDTLQRYGVQAVYSSYGYARTTYFAYTTLDNGYVLKTPTPTEEEPKYVRQTKGVYCFGYSQLMAAQNVKAVLFVGGEDDALCINQHCNGLGVFAVTVGSEKAKIDKGLFSKVREKCDRVVFCYDNDSVGIEYSKKYALEFDVDYVDTKFFYERYDGKDFCDMYARCIEVEKRRGTDSVMLRAVDRFCSTIASMLDASTQIKADDDSFSIPVNNVLQCDFNQYLSEPKPFEFLIRALDIYKRIIVQAPAGTGKSRVQAYVAKYVKQSGLDGALMLAPSVSIAEQGSISMTVIYKDSSDSCVGLWGRATTEKLDNALFATTIICTYDKLAMLLTVLDLDKYLLVVDEFHKVVCDFSYRSKVDYSVFNIIKKAKNCILLTATPNYFFASNLLPEFDFKVVRFNPKVTNKIEVTTIEHTDTKAGVMGMIKNYSPDGIGTHCIKMDNNSNLGAFVKKHSTNLTVKNIEHLTSKDPKKREHNETYKSIMANGGKDVNLEWLLFTSLLEQGVSFIFPVKCMSLLDVMSWYSLIQIPTRPRLQSDGTNELVKVNLFLKYKEDRNDADGEKAKEKTAIEHFQHLYKLAEKTAKKWNENPKVAIKELKEYDRLRIEKANSLKASTDADYYVVSDDNGTYEPDVLKILYKIYVLETASATPALLELRVNRVDNRFVFIHNKPLNEENSEIKDIIEANKGDVETCNNGFLDLLKVGTTNVLKAVYTKTMDVNLRDEIENVLLKENQLRQKKGVELWATDILCSPLGIDVTNFISDWTHGLSLSRFGDIGECLSDCNVMEFKAGGAMDSGERLHVKEYSNELDKIDRPQSLHFIKHCADLFSTRLHYKAVKDVIKCVRLGFSLKDAVSYFLANGSAKITVVSDLATYKERKKLLKDEYLDKDKDQYLKDFYKFKAKIKEYKKNLRKGNTKQLLTSDYLCKMLNSCVDGTKYTKPRAVEMLKRIYEVEVLRGVLSGKKVSYYELGKLQALPDTSLQID